MQLFASAKVTTKFTIKQESSSSSLPSCQPSLPMFWPVGHSRSLHILFDYTETTTLLLEGNFGIWKNPHFRKRETEGHLGDKGYTSES